MARKQATCHPEKFARSHGLCRTCANRKDRHFKRSLGLPYWRAQGRTYEGWLSHLKSVKGWVEKNRDRVRTSNRLQTRRRTAKYGGNPSKIFTARLAWMEDRKRIAKEQEKERKKLSGKRWTKLLLGVDAVKAKHYDVRNSHERDKRA